MTVGIDYARLVISNEELYMSLLQEVQNLEENRDRLVLSLDDGRQVLFLDYLQQNEFCFAEVRVHFGIEDLDGIIIVIELTRNVQGT